MELFAAAGVELPLMGGGRQPRVPMRAQRVPLLNHKVVKEARGKLAFSPDETFVARAKSYARKVRDDKFRRQAETAVRPVFIEEVLKGLLGYSTTDPDGEFTLAFEKPIRRGAVDVALGRFRLPGDGDAILAPFELKGPQTLDLDRVMPGRGRSPVQQAWDYAIDAPGSRWVLVSNCVEIRLYAFGRGRDAYEHFDLTRLDEEEELARLWLLLSQERLLGGGTEALLAESDRAYRDITDELYKDFRSLRDRLIQFLADSADGPRLAPLPAIETAQKVLDRILFIAFAQRTDLLPSKLLELAARAGNEFIPQPIWRNFLELFKMVDVGNNRLGIPAYNGGLFARDPVADDLVLPDELARDVAALGQWDYRQEVPVTVLGHIFEQSITDIERKKAEGQGEAPPREAAGKRKREGVVYTPDMVTRFLVERTLNLTLSERFAALWRAHGLSEGVEDEDKERGFWREYLAGLRALTVLDPACGSGAFLVAAFDALAAEYRRVTGRLAELGEAIDFDPYDEIVTRNLFGVDLNAESVEITRLSLWLRTARRDHRLQNLEATIRVGDSLIDDPAFTQRPFDWQAAFPEVFAAGGFDIVLGNPPYVRMELIKPLKPHLEKHYVVAADRADLYAYFFERGVRALRPGGRLGYISSSTFFRTGSGANLRTFLTDGVEIESVVDFGDIQIFEGVTTYPAILTLRKPAIGESAGGAAGEGDLLYLTLKDRLPEDLGAAFTKDALPMPRARLGAGSWRFEPDALAALRGKIVAGRRTLGEVYGAPLYGIKTGLNEAFVIDRATRDRLIAAHPASADILRPFLRGENVKRWRVESEDLWLINTPKGKVDIEAYPAIRDWLLPFRPQLEARATKQEWWELQQAQLAYQDRMNGSKIVFPDLSQGAKYVVLEELFLLDCTLFFLSTNDEHLVSLLNSHLYWFYVFGLSNPLRGGEWRLRLKAQYVEALPIPEMPPAERARLAELGRLCTDEARARHGREAAFRRRILDLAPGGEGRLSNRLEAFHALSFPAFMEEVKKALRADIPLRQRGEWETFHAQESAAIAAHSGRIAEAEREIDAITYALFALGPDEIALIEASLAGRN